MRQIYNFYTLDGVYCEWDCLTNKTTYPIYHSYSVVEKGYIYFCYEDGEVIEKCEIL